MSIHIPHRFIDRLQPNEDIKSISLVVIGTFNPGEPELEKLTNSELQEFMNISEKPKFKKFSKVKNFYDRPQNRFWKIMDFIHNYDFYYNKALNVRNTNGLKFYRKMDRSIVFANQQLFCKKYGVFITDIVQKIEADSFTDIYDNFPDKKIENSRCTWNTQQILDIIERYNPSKILINFKCSDKIPKISAEINKIKSKYSSKIISLLSTSGSAGNKYEDLLKDWLPHFNRNVNI